MMEPGCTSPYIYMYIYMHVIYSTLTLNISHHKYKKYTKVSVKKKMKKIPSTHYS